MLGLCCGMKAQQLQLGALIALGKTRGQTASSVLEGEFSTTGPQGSSPSIYSCKQILISFRNNI